MIDIIAAMFGIIATSLLAFKKETNKRVIFTLYLITNILFIIYALTINSVGILLLNVVYLILSIIGLIRKEDSK
jgi:hypothetical protein